MLKAQDFQPVYIHECKAFEIKISVNSMLSGRNTDGFDVMANDLTIKNRFVTESSSA